MYKLFSFLPVFLFIFIIAPANAAVLNSNYEYNKIQYNSMASEYYKPTASTTVAPAENKNAKQSKRRFYAGFSLAYTASVYGGMNSDYAKQPDAWKVPGSFYESEFETDPRVIPIQVSFGANIAGGLRADVSYMRYSGVSIPGRVKIDAAGRGYNDYLFFHATGGDVSGGATILNIYYDFGGLTGRFLGGKLSPYLGAGIGLATNKISDYEIFDKDFNDIDSFGNGYSDINALHYGGTSKNNLAYSFEAGGTSQIFDRLLLDIFVRWTELGQVQTKGDILLTQTVHEYPNPPHNETLYYHDLRESGAINILDIGVRLRFLF